MLLHLRWTLIVVGCLFFAGCFPTSVNPISTPTTSSVDSRVEGVFVGRRENKDDALSVFHFHYRREKTEGSSAVRVTPWLEIVNVAHPKDGALGAVAYRGLTTHIGSHDYVSLMEMGGLAADANGQMKLEPGVKKAQAYFLFRYEVSGGGDLRLWMIDNEPVIAAIKAGKLRGEVEPVKTSATPAKGKVQGKEANLFTQPLITDSSEHLAAFIASSDPAVLFSGKPMVFYRIAR